MKKRKSPMPSDFASDLLDYLEEDSKRMRRCLRNTEQKKMLGEYGIAMVNGQLLYANSVMNILKRDGGVV